MNNLWPDEFISAHLRPDHCADVLGGSYDVPFAPPRAPVILDIGANVGAFARWASARWPGAKVHCFEPHPGNYALLQKTVVAYGLDRVLTYNAGICDIAGAGRLKLAFTNCGAHSLFETGEVGSAGIPVALNSSANLPKADILKIDTEGAEWPILSALNVAGRLPEFSAIMLEYHSEQDCQRITELLKSLGFVLTGSKFHCEHRGELKFVRGDLLPAPVPAPAARPLNIYIATPSHDHKFHANYVFSLMRLANHVWSKKIFGFTVGKVGGAGVARARNNMAQEFLAGDFTHYFCVDADIGFEPEWFTRLVALDLPIVGGLYSLKQHKLQWCLNTLKPDVPPDDERGIQEVATTGTGFLCIKREVFEAMVKECPEIAYTDDLAEAKGRTRWDFFSMGVLNGRYLSEDWYFCVRARALGFKTYVDTTFKLEHEGLISYPIDPAKLGIEIAAEEKAAA